MVRCTHQEIYIHLPIGKEIASSSVIFFFILHAPNRLGWGTRLLHSSIEPNKFVCESFLKLFLKRLRFVVFLFFMCVFCVRQRTFLMCTSRLARLVGPRHPMPVRQLHMMPHWAFCILRCSRSRKQMKMKFCSSMSCRTTVS